MSKVVLLLLVYAGVVGAQNISKLGTPNLTANSATFGQITATATAPRQIQFGVRYSFQT